MRELIKLFKQNPLYLLLLISPMFEAIWVNVTGVNIIDLLSKDSNSTFWISIISFITLAPGSLFMLFTSKLASYRIMPFAILAEAIGQFAVSFTIGLNIESIKPVNLAIFQIIIVITNAISTPCIFMLNRDVLKKDELKAGATGGTIFYMLTNSFGLLLAPIAHYRLNLKYIFYIEGILALVTAGLLYLVFLKIPRRREEEAISADDKSSKLSNFHFFGQFFKIKSNILTFVLPPLLYLAMSLPTAGLPVWIIQNKNITTNFTIFYAAILWIRTLGGFAGGFLFQKYYPSKRDRAIKSTFACIAIAPLVYGFAGSLSSLFFLIPLILLSHTLSNYSYSAVWYEVDCMGEGNYIARIHSLLLIIDSLILSTGPLIIGYLGDFFGVKAIWLANSIFIFLVIIFLSLFFNLNRKEIRV